MEIFDKALTWIKANVLIALAILAAVVMVFFPKLLFGSPRRRITRRPAVRRITRRRRALPRSVGTRRRVARNKNGTAKKPWQIKGSEAARRHMRKIRNMR